jgi:hypothetical protein
VDASDTNRMIERGICSLSGFLARLFGIVAAILIQRRTGDHFLRAANDLAHQFRDGFQDAFVRRDKPIPGRWVLTLD